MKTISYGTLIEDVEKHITKLDDIRFDLRKLRSIKELRPLNVEELVSYDSLMGSLEYENRQFMKSASKVNDLLSREIGLFLEEKQNRKEIIL